MLPLIGWMIRSGCRHLVAVGVMDARPLIQTMQAVAVAVCCCCVPCLAVIVDGLPLIGADAVRRCRAWNWCRWWEVLPLIRRMIRSGCRHLVAVAFH